MSELKETTLAKYGSCEAYDLRELCWCAISSPIPEGPPLGDPDAWDAIMKICQDKLESEDFERICSLGSLEGLVQYSKSLQDSYSEKNKAYEFVRLNGFVNQLKTFNTNFDVLSRVKPTAAAPLWGSIRLCIEVCVLYLILESILLI
jgi:hypothetical protein